MTRSETPFYYILCTDRKGVIGIDQQLPFHVPLDMQRFRSLTSSSSSSSSSSSTSSPQNAVLMGYRTWQSVPKAHRPLPSRINMVLTRSDEHANEVRSNGGYPFASVSRMLEFVQSATQLISGVFVMGGAEVYRLPQLMERVSRIHWTMVDTDVQERFAGLGSDCHPCTIFDVQQWVRTARTGTRPTFDTIEKWTANTLVQQYGDADAENASLMPVVFHTLVRSSDTTGGTLGGTRGRIPTSSS